VIKTETSCLFLAAFIIVIHSDPGHDLLYINRLDHEFKTFVNKTVLVCHLKSTISQTFKYVLALGYIQQCK